MRGSVRGKSGRSVHRCRSDLSRASHHKIQAQCGPYAPTLSTRSAMSSNTLPPCMTITLDAISSVLYAAASFCTASALSRCTRVADIATFRPLLSPTPARPNECARPHGLWLKPEPRFMDPSAAADRPEVARTESSDASSMSRRICVTDLNTPGSIGGGVALPGLGDGKGGGEGSCAKVLRGESGGEWSPRLAKPCIRRDTRPSGLLVGGGGSAGRRVSDEDCNVAGSRFMTSRDSRSSTGSCSHGP